MRTSYITGGGTNGFAPVINQSALWADRAAYQFQGNTVRFTDIGGNSGAGGGSFFFYTNTRWKATNGQALLDAVDTPNSGITGVSEQNLNPNAIIIPAGVIQGNDRLYLRIKAGKSGSTDAATINVRIGSTKTATDALIAALTMSAANRSIGCVLDLKRVDATSIIRGGANINDSMGGPANTAYPSAVTLAGGDSFDANALYLTIWQVMGGVADTITLQDYTLTLESTDS